MNPQQQSHSQQIQPPPFWIPHPNPNLEYWVKPPCISVIYGKYYVRRTIQTGVFTCPYCKKRLPFKHKRIRLKSHCYFIPCGCGQDMGEYVKCGQCNLHFDKGILSHHPKKSQTP